LKEVKKSEIINHLMKFGDVLLIASDVNPLPKGVEKIASSLGCKIFYPKVSMSYKEKSKIIEDYKREIKDSHQKDALAAALRAFKNYHSFFLKVEEEVKKIGREDLFEKVLKRVFKKRGENIVNAIKEILEKEENEKENKRKID